VREYGGNRRCVIDATYCLCFGLDFGGGQARAAARGATLKSDIRAIRDMSLQACTQRGKLGKSHTPC
jgi:hypothetical protein